MCVNVYACVLTLAQEVLAIFVTQLWVLHSAVSTTEKNSVWERKEGEGGRGKRGKGSEREREKES